MRIPASSPPCNTAAEPAGSSYSLVLGYFMQFFKDWGFPPFWSFRNPRATGTGTGKWSMKCPKQRMRKAIRSTCSTVPTTSFSLGMTETNCFICQFILFTQNYIHIAEGISFKYRNRKWPAGLSVWTRALPVRPWLLRARLSPELCNSRLWFLFQRLRETQGPTWVLTISSANFSLNRQAMPGSTRFCTQVQVTTNQPCKVTGAIPQFSSEAWLPFSFFGTKK